MTSSTRARPVIDGKSASSASSAGDVAALAGHHAPAASRARAAGAPARGCRCRRSPARACAAQIGGQVPLGAVVRGRAGELAGDEALDPGAVRLLVEPGDAVVADVRLRHHHDLAAVGGVGQDLLVAGHRGVEDDLAEAGARARRRGRRRANRPRGAAGLPGRRRASAGEYTNRSPRADGSGASRRRTDVAVPPTARTRSAPSAVALDRRAGLRLHDRPQGRHPDRRQVEVHDPGRPRDHHAPLRHRRPPTPLPRSTSRRPSRRTGRTSAPRS